MSKKEEQPDRLKQFISWVDGDREPKDRTLFVMETVSYTHLTLPTNYNV